MSTSKHRAVIPWPEALRTFTHIGLNSFGGPAGQIAVMHRVLVEEKKWLSESRFLHALIFYRPAACTAGKILKRRSLPAWRQRSAARRVRR